MKKVFAVLLSLIMVFGIMSGTMTAFAKSTVVVEISENEFIFGEIPLTYIMVSVDDIYVKGAKFTVKDSDSKVIAEAEAGENDSYARLFLPVFTTPGLKDLKVTVTKDQNPVVDDYPLSVYIKYNAPQDNITVFDNGTKKSDPTATTVNIKTYAGIVGISLPVVGVTAEKNNQKTMKYEGNTYSVETVSIYVPDYDNVTTVNISTPEGATLKNGKYVYSLSSGRTTLTNFPLNSSLDIIIPATDITIGTLLQLSIESVHLWDDYTFDDDNHWHECKACGEIKDKEAHDLNAKGACKVCSYKLTKQEFTLAFEPNGGTDFADVKLEKGKQLDLANYIPERIGYTFAGWYFDKEFTKKAEVVELTADTSVYAKWTKTVNPFTDVKTTDTYYEDIMYVYNQGLMIGLTDKAFGPESSITRAMIVTILYRLEGEPAFMNDNVFTDVAAGSYYEKAVVWANGKGIVTGYPGNKFAPEKAISRQELLTIVYRYCQYKEYDMSGNDNTNTLDFNDIMDVADYAAAAVHWGIHTVFEPEDLMILPKDAATRAFTACVFHNLCTKVVK